MIAFLIYMCEIMINAPNREDYLVEALHSREHHHLDQVVLSSTGGSKAWPLASYLYVSELYRQARLVATHYYYVIV